MVMEARPVRYFQEPVQQVLRKVTGKEDGDSPVRQSPSLLRDTGQDTGYKIQDTAIPYRYPDGPVVALPT